MIFGMPKRLIFGYLGLECQLSVPDPAHHAHRAEHISLSASSTSRLFSRATGVSFADTVSRLRLSAARRLLTTTDGESD